ncbi:MAG: DUF6261 family protein [Tannerella sp.]|jgi:hypothetical protein|nr:DUF6261 family protein [Tannerella sp.]
MQINTFSKSKLHNSEYFQFFTEEKDLIDLATPAALGIAPQYPAFVTKYYLLDDNLKLIFKSPVTAERVEADHVRDNTFAGTHGAVQNAKHHFNPEIVKAAGRVAIVFDTYGNIAHKSYNEETADIFNLLRELRTHHAPDIELLGLLPWLEKLEADNLYFESLTKERIDEMAKVSEDTVKAIRLDLNAIHDDIVARVNARLLLMPDDICENFARKLNACIKLYADTLAQRSGRRHEQNDLGI